MYLRADHVSLEFPLSGGPHATAAHDPEHPLGGRIVERNGKARVLALDGVSIALDSGDRMAVVGHNGSGKSSLLRVLAGIYHPSSGRVAASTGVSGIFNMSLGLRQEATGYRNLVLKGLMAGRTRAEVDALVPSIAEFTGLGPYLDMPLQSYSQGMAMRLAFAATTALANDILVMDEWIGAGDAGFQEKIVERMNGLVQRSRILVVASHSSALLRRIANRAIWLEHGKVRMEGGVDEVLDAYEEAVQPSGLPPQVEQALAGGEGLWLEPAGNLVPEAHLFWRVDRRPPELNLYVRKPGGARQVVRHRVRRSGTWALPHWARPGQTFELAGGEEEPALAEWVMPPA